MKEAYRTAVDSVSSLIRSHLAMAVSEEVQPSKDPDSMDKYIRTHREAADRLRAIRNLLEETEAMKDYLEP